MAKHSQNNELRTAGGYPLDEAVSALQKEIRRGNEEEALFWAQEIESRFHNYLWRRLVIIAHEDIGIANPMVQMYIMSAYQAYTFLRDQGHQGCLPLTNAVLVMCRSPKTRMADHLVWLVWNQDYKLDIPDYALDKHTKRGRKMGRSWDHFLNEGAKVVPEVPELNTYKERAYAIASKMKPREWLKAWKSKPRTQRGKVEDIPVDESEPENETGEQGRLF